MRRRAPGTLIAAVLAAATLAASTVGSAGRREDRVRLALLPCSNIETTFRKFQPLLAHLKAATGLTVTIAVPTDLAELEALIKNGQIDFALQDPHTFALTARWFDRATVLQTRALDGTTSQSGVVVVRRDSGLSRLSQLRGRTVMFGPRASTAKWIAARLLFGSSGIDVDRDLKASNGGCCEDIAFAVSLRSVDAGVICDHFLSRHEDKQKDLGVDTAALVGIARTPAFPTRVFAARQGAAREATDAITQALLRLDPAVEEHARLLSSAEMRGFQRATEADYQALLALASTRGVR